MGIDSNRVIKEATNSISAGVFIAHGHKSMYGSDVQDLDKYTEKVEELPELRLSVDSFEHFAFYLKKMYLQLIRLLNVSIQKY